jgi:hypothetical protein
MSLDVFFHSRNTQKKCVAYPQEDFVIKTDSKVLKKCVFEQFFQILEIMKFKKKIDRYNINNPKTSQMK